MLKEPNEHQDARYLPLMVHGKYHIFRNLSMDFYKFHNILPFITQIPYIPTISIMLVLKKIEQRRRSFSDLRRFTYNYSFSHSRCLNHNTPYHIAITTITAAP